MSRVSDRLALGDMEAREIVSYYMDRECNEWQEVA